MRTTIQQLAEFLNACRGNWRNACFISCGVCKCHSPCSGYLMSADAGGTPVLISIAEYERLTAQRITDALSSGKLVIAIMSAGHFTSSGHFIVLRGVQDEKILVADPASRTRSEQSWDLSIILNEASKAAGSGGPFWIIG